VAGIAKFQTRDRPQHWLVEMACAERKTVQQLMLDYSRKSGIGSERAYAKLMKHFHPATTEKLKKGISWCWLQPRGCILADARDHGEAQDAILVRYGLGWGKRELACYLAFSLEVPDHCLARLIQRAPGADLHAVLRQAHRAYFEADAEIVTKHIDAKASFYLPCGPGLLICEGLRAATSRWFFVYARPRTWISSEMARPDQRPIAPAVGTPTQFEVMTALALESGQ
jgi:hypothetical protein